MTISVADRGAIFYWRVVYGVNVSRLLAMIYSANASAVDLCRVRSQFSIRGNGAATDNMRCAEGCIGLVNALRHALFSARYRVRQPVAGRFQPYRHTLPDRYPWLFDFAASTLDERPDCHLLSFGCSRGDEALALRTYFPHAAIKGIDFDRRNIARCRARIKKPGISFSVAATTSDEPARSYDAIFCLAVLCHGYLTISDAQRCRSAAAFCRFRANGERISPAA